MDYFEKLEKNTAKDLTWNIPEMRQGTVNIIGGNSQNFRTAVKVSEYVNNKYPIKTLNTVLPDALRGKLPDLPNFVFLGSTDSGSFADAEELGKAMNSADFNLVVGDLSRNAITGGAVASASEIAEKPMVVTRDTVDLVVENGVEKLLMNERIIFFASMPQLQKLFRAVYYPKMLMLSQSLIQVADALHKFTLSYPTKIVTLHNGQVLIAANGEVKAAPLTATGQTPLTFWNGELAAKIMALNLYNPNNFVDATICAIFD